jgi:hypothetical protein
VQQQATKQEQQLQQFEAALKGDSSSSGSAEGQNWVLLKKQLLSSLSG